VLDFTYKRTPCAENNSLTEKEQGKGKAVPLQAWTGPEGSRKLRVPDFRDNGTG